MVEPPTDSATNGVSRIRLVGGNLAIDFVNTRTGPPVGATDDDVLVDYDSLLRWSTYAGELTETETGMLSALSHAHPTASREVFARALRTRGTLDGILRAVSLGREPDAAAMRRLAALESDALANATLEPGLAFARSWSWTWRNLDTFERPLWPVVHAAVELLTLGDPRRIKGCSGCRFLFYDESKNSSRRWCSMDDCGKSEKMRRYVAARRARPSEQRPA
jgi:predicted RNA-binding Zn ribbon-like protein